LAVWRVENCASLSKNNCSGKGESKAPIETTFELKAVLKKHLASRKRK